MLSQIKSYETATIKLTVVAMEMFLNYSINSFDQLFENLTISCIIDKLPIEIFWQDFRLTS